MSEQPADNDLVKQVQCGNKQAFDLLVNRYQFRILKLTSRYVSEPSEMSDITQEVFIKAYRALANFRGDSAFYTWLYRIAINTAKNHLAAKGRRPPDTDLCWLEAEYVNAEYALSEASSPEHELLSAEISQTIFSVIDELPLELKTAITLRELEGLSYEAIAQTMDCPIGTVRSRIFRAREAIDKELKPLLGG